MELMKLVARISDVAVQHRGRISGGGIDFDKTESTFELMFGDDDDHVTYEVTIKRALVDAKVPEDG